MVFQVLTYYTPLTYDVLTLFKIEEAEEEDKVTLDFNVQKSLTNN